MSTKLTKPFPVNGVPLPTGHSPYVAYPGPEVSRARHKAQDRFAQNSDGYVPAPGSGNPFITAPSRPPPGIPSVPPVPPKRSPPRVPQSELKGFEDDFADGKNEGPPLSMNGLESGLPTDLESLGPESSISDDNTVASSSSHRHSDAKERYKKGLEVISYIKEKSAYDEDDSAIILRLQMAADRKLRRSYVRGRPVIDYYESAPIIKVGIVFLPGVDRPSVTQVEQEMLMADYKPDQQTAEWRVNTAGNLLLDLEVTQDMRVIFSDATPQVLDHTRKKRDGILPFLPNQKAADALILASKEKVPIVNIDSEQVKLVSDLRRHSGEFDLESTLIEVDATSMMNLLVNFRLIIQNRNASQDLDETRNLLESMMEDVRRLCNRSAILFRMSTRTKIITSKDIRYGFTNGREFTPLTTSTGIRKIISMSSAYYTSLDPADKVQQMLKPRFLQMLVLLLSFLNEEDLRNIQGFIEQTFHFRADRQNLELLFLKVIPFYSINEHVFLTSLIPAIEGEGYAAQPPDHHQHAPFWETFISRIAHMGYLLPGTVESLCRAQQSWIVQWPELGFKNSLAFRNLQYGAHDHLRTFNEIPPIEKDYDRRNNDMLLNAILTNNTQFLVRVADYEAIVCVTKGVYSMQETKLGGQRFDLTIDELALNEATYHAVDKLNDVIKRVNHWLTGFRSTTLRKRNSMLSSMKIPGVRKFEVEMMEEMRVTGKLTRYRATLGNDLLAITYKLDGRKITLADALATMSRDKQAIQSIIAYYQGGLQNYANAIGQSTLRQISNALNSVSTELSLSDGMRQTISSDPTISDEPIVTLIEPPGGSIFSAPVWNEYHASVIAGNRLSIDAKKSYVAYVDWGTETIIALHNDPNRYIVAPLEYVDENDRDDQVHEGDVAVLAGQYMILAEPVEEEGTDGLIMSNYLKIIRVDHGATVSKRAQRRMQPVAINRSVFV